jgi:hypothetical protein
MSTLDRIPTRALEALYILGALALIAALILIAFKAGYVGYYHGLNTGITFGGYGLEVSGTPGVFKCGSEC